MSTVQLDETLIAQARRSPRHDGLSFDERVALNLLWRKKVRVLVLAKVFKCSKNTIYYNCLTGDAPSYPASGNVKAREIHELIDRIGEAKAWRQYVTQPMILAVNAANRELTSRRKAA